MKGFGDSGRNEDLDGAGIGGVKLRSGEASNRTRERSESNSGLWTVCNKVFLVVHENCTYTVSIFKTI